MHHIAVYMLFTLFHPSSTLHLIPRRIIVCVSPSVNITWMYQFMRCQNNKIEHVIITTRHQQRIISFRALFIYGQPLDVSTTRSVYKYISIEIIDIVFRRQSVTEYKVLLCSFGRLSCEIAISLLFFFISTIELRFSSWYIHIWW